jgi:phosphate transport system permease protein
MAIPAVVTVPPTASVKAFKKRLIGGDEIAFAITWTFAALILLVTVMLVWALYVKSGPARSKFGFDFFTSRVWDPPAEKFGALPFIYGTMLTSVVALLISVPLGVGAAIFLSEMAPRRISDIATFLVELLAAVPSVIYGLLAIFTVIPLLRSYGEPFLERTLGFLPFFQGPAYGVGFLAAGIILAIMTFPFIISISRESLMDVPREQREAALALGATKWEATWQAVVPYARLGIIGSIFLGLARALGETMAVTMVIGNTPIISASLFSPGTTIAATLAGEFTEAMGDVYLASLVYLGLVLFLLTIVINGMARILIIATTKKGSTI